jgi:uncharacterized protein (UPF0276 family)
MIDFRTGTRAETFARAGIGLRGPHLAAIVAAPPAVGFLEVHPENYMGGGPVLAALECLRRDRDLSLHGVGLSLGGTDCIDCVHLNRLAELVERLEPAFVSEHLSWSMVDGIYLNDLLPLPYTQEALDLTADHIKRVQDRLRRRILIENPSSYLRYCSSTLSEPAFLLALVERTGCGLLCDINNIHVSARNLGFDPLSYLDGLPGGSIEEFHLAGHSVNEVGGQEILIDDHGSVVADEVWALYRSALSRFGPRPTLIEWDSRLPALPVLLAEAAKADEISAEIPTERCDVRAA